MTLTWSTITSDVVSEADGDGTDTVLSSISFSLADSAMRSGASRTSTLTGTGKINATGNALDNIARRQ